MSGGNLRAVFYGKEDIRLSEEQIPEPGPGQIQIRVENVGICGSDLSFWNHNGIPDCLEGKDPYGIGHEGAGIVSRLGEGVTSLKIGDKVAMDPLASCERCYDCKTGRFNLCEKVAICGFPGHWGYMARYFVENAKHCFRLPDHISTEEGAMLEPLAVALHGCRRAGVSAGNNVLITGAGPIGLLAMKGARALGALKICVTDVNETRIKLAKQLGADYALDVTSKEALEIEKMVEECFGEKPHMTIECSGAPTAIQAAIRSTRNGGRVSQIALGEGNVTIPMINASFREVDILGIRSNPYCTPLALDLVASGRIDVKPLVTHRFDLENVAEAFKKAQTRDCGKVMIGIPRDITTKAGKHTKRCEIKLFDESCSCFPLVLWGEELVDYSQTWIQGETVLFVADVRMNYDDFRSCMVATADSKTVFTPNPDTVDAKCLHQFALTQNFQEDDDGLREQSDPPLEAIKDIVIIEQIATREGVSSDFAILYGVITKFDIDSHNIEQFCRRKCCKCKQIVTADTGYQCSNPSCSQAIVFNTTGDFAQGQTDIDYSIPISISDHTGTIQCRLSADILQNLTGWNPKDLMAVPQEGRTELKWQCLLERCKFYIKMLRNYHNPERLSVRVMSCCKVDSTKMLQNISTVKGT